MEVKPVTVGTLNGLYNSSQQFVTEVERINTMLREAASQMQDNVTVKIKKDALLINKIKFLFEEESYTVTVTYPEKIDFSGDEEQVEMNFRFGVNMK